MKGASNLVLTVMTLVLLATAPSQAQPVAETPAPAAGGPAARGPGAATLAGLLAEALARNPAIAAKEAALRAAGPRAVAAGVWPEPMFTSGFKNMGLLPTLGQDPGTELSLGLAQTVPFPGKTRLRTEAAEASRDRAAADLEQTRRDVGRKVKEAWFDLYEAQRKLEINAETRTLLARAAETAAARYRVGQVGQTDVLKAEVEGARMLDESAMLDAQRLSLEGTLAGLLGRPPLTAHFGAVATPDLAVPDLPLEALAEGILARAPELARAAADTREAEKNLALSRMDVLPDLTLMGQLMNRGAMAGGWEVSASVDLPVFYRARQEQMVGERAAMADQMRRDRDMMALELLAMVRTEVAMARSAAIREGLVRTSLMPRARQAFQAVLAGYTVGKDDFLALLDAIMIIQGFQQEQAAVLVAGNKALARLEAILGETPSGGGR